MKQGFSVERTVSIQREVAAIWRTEEESCRADERGDEVMVVV